MIPSRNTIRNIQKNVRYLGGYITDTEGGSTVSSSVRGLQKLDTTIGPLLDAIDAARTDPEQERIAYDLVSELIDQKG